MLQDTSVSLNSTAEFKHNNDICWNL